jgi:uncharacterized membrane protein HdeD (DUF308 family)
MLIQPAVSRLWWALVLRGVVALLLGIVTLTRPAATLGFMVLLFAIYALAEGVASLVLGLTQFRTQERWWAAVTGGVVSIAAGLVAIAWPAITLAVTLGLMAGWAVLRGALDILAAIRLRREIDGEWAMGFSGALSIVFGILIMAAPIAGAVAITWYLGIYACVVGVTLMLCGFRLKRAVAWA